jgi:hypothetical protein
LILAGLIVAGAVAGLVWPGEREPEYQGTKLSEWLRMYSELREPEDTYKAVQKRTAKPADAIRQIGTNAIPYFVAWIRYDTPKWRQRLGGIIQKLPVAIQRSSIVATVTRDKAKGRADLPVVGFPLLGASGRAAVPELYKILRDSTKPESSWRAMRCLAAIGEVETGPLR